MTNLRFAPPDLGTVLLFTGLPGGSNKIHDRSPYGNIGTITGATWVRLPSGLWCLSFDGNDDQVDCGSVTSFDITDALTIEVWVNVSSYTDFRYIVAKGADKYALYNKQTSGDLEFWLNLSGGSVHPDTPFTPGTDTWAQVVATYNKDGGSNNTKIYINGVVAKQETNTGTINTDTNSLYVGRRLGAACPFHGSIALPRVYNRALNALQIHDDFNREKHLFGVW